MSISLLGEASQWIMPGILLAMLVILFGVNIYRNKKFQDKTKNVLEALKPGDRVKTYSGFYGTIVEIKETTDGKVAVLETGSENNRGYMSIDMNAIYGIDEKKEVVLDMTGNPIEETNSLVDEVEKTAEIQSEPVEIETEPVKEPEVESNQTAESASKKRKPKKIKEEN